MNIKMMDFIDVNHDDISLKRAKRPVYRKRLRLEDLGSVSQKFPQIFLSFVLKSMFKFFKYARAISLRHGFHLQDFFCK